MTGQELSAETEKRVLLLFPREELADVRRILRDECGSNLPFCENGDSIQMERVRFAVLKLSEGDRDKLLRAVQLAHGTGETCWWWPVLRTMSMPTNPGCRHSASDQQSTLERSRASDRPWRS
jgi:hypothetical protein